MHQILCHKLYAYSSHHSNAFRLSVVPSSGTFISTVVNSQRTEPHTLHAMSIYVPKCVNQFKNRISFTWFTINHTDTGNEFVKTYKIQGRIFRHPLYFSLVETLIRTLLTRGAVYVWRNIETRSLIFVAVESDQGCLLICACLRACRWVPGRVDVFMRISSCTLANPACNAYASYCDVICVSSVFTIFFGIIS
jgi:hypothetical protein